MKTLLLCLAPVLIVLAGCGPAFQAGDFSPAGEAGSGGAPGAAGQIGLSRAGSAPAGHAGAPGAMGGSSAGSAAEASAGASDAAGAAGAAGEASSAAGAGGSAGMGPCGHPVLVQPDPYTVVGAQPVCLQNKASFIALTFRGWDNRSVKINGAPFACFSDASDGYTCSIQGNFPPAIGGYNYLELGAGTSAMVSIEWVM